MPDPNDFDLWLEEHLNWDTNAINSCYEQIRDYRDILNKHKLRYLNNKIITDPRRSATYLNLIKETKQEINDLTGNFDGHICNTNAFMINFTNESNIKLETPDATDTTDN